jgi:hypothetical protein
MAIPLTPNKSFLWKNSSCPRLVKQGVLTSLLVEKEIFIKEFLAMVRVINQKMNRERLKGDNT